MEQRLTIIDAKTLFGNNFIGPEEIESIASRMNVQAPSKLKDNIPEIPFTKEELIQKCKSHILILLIPFDYSGKSISLLSLISNFGRDPSIAEPCFYNQDWYVNENFAKTCTISLKWCMISKNVIDESKGRQDDYITRKNLPTALESAYTFFAYYLLNNKIIWPKNFIWCSDTDTNGDRIYVGRYYDPLGIAKNGFSIHRHLRITPIYGCVDVSSY